MNTYDICFLKSLGIPAYIVEKISKNHSDLRAISTTSTGQSYQNRLNNILKSIDDLPKDSLLRELPLIKSIQEVLLQEVEEDAVYLLEVKALGIVRADNALKVRRVNYLFQLVQLTEDDLFTVTNINRKTISIIVESLKEFGLHLGMVLSSKKISNFEEKLGIRNEPFSFEIKM